jgi:hypothetical protein
MKSLHDSDDRFSAWPGALRKNLGRRKENARAAAMRRNCGDKPFKRLLAMTVWGSYFRTSTNDPLL